MSEQLFRAARAVVEEMSTSVSTAWQGEGVIAIPIRKLIELEEAIQSYGIRRSSCPGCGTPLGIGQPLRDYCARDGCRERYERRIRRDGMAYP